MLFYLDSSAWVKRYFRERGSGWINQEFAHEILLGGSTLGLIEVTATCARKRTAGAIDAVRFQQIEDDLLDDWSGFFQMELTPEVVERSLELGASGHCAALTACTSPRRLSSRRSLRSKRTSSGSSRQTWS